MAVNRRLFARSSFRPGGFLVADFESAIRCKIQQCRIGNQVCSVWWCETNMQELEPYSGAAIFTAIVIAWILDSDRFRWDCIQRSLSLGLQTAIGIAGGSYIWGFRCSDDNRWVSQTCFAKYPPRTSKSLRTKRVCNPSSQRSSSNSQHMANTAPHTTCIFRYDAGM